MNSNLKSSTHFFCVFLFHNKINAFYCFWDSKILKMEILGVTPRVSFHAVFFQELLLKICPKISNFDLHFFLLLRPENTRITPQTMHDFFSGDLTALDPVLIHFYCFCYFSGCWNRACFCPKRMHKIFDFFQELSIA